MLMLPLPAQPDWRRLPYLTLLLICACFVVFVLQGRDWNHSQEAMRFYRDSSLAAVELPAYVADLAQRDPERAAPLAEALSKKAFSEVWRTMEGDPAFMARLESEQVITPDQAAYRRWRDDRRLYATLRGRNLTERLAFKPHAPAPFDFLTHPYPHGGMFHLASNLAMLLMIGYALELAVGPLIVFGLFMIGSVISVVPSIFLPIGEYTLIYGAAGPIATLMGFYAVLFGRQRVTFFYWLIARFGKASWPALALFALWLINEVLQYLVLDKQNSINYLGHLAALVCGGLLAAIYRWQTALSHIPPRLNSPKLIGKLRKRAKKALKRGQYGLAADGYRTLSEALPDDSEIARAFIETARLAGQPGILRDAAAHLLTLAVKNPEKLPAASLAAALGDIHPYLPRFSAKGWRRIISQLIQGREIETVERLVLQLLAQADQGEFGPELQQEITHAFERTGTVEHSARLLRLIDTRVAIEN